MDATPRGNRIRIAFFGLRNAGKSTLVNAFCGQEIAIVSDTPGTTTDPVSKAMEILPLGPCLITDTAGLDDVGELGEQRVRKSLDVLAISDVAVWVEAGLGEHAREVTSITGTKRRFLEACERHHTTVLEYHRGDSVEALKKKIAALPLAAEDPALLAGLVKPGEQVVLVCPIDSSAPKGRLILPQVQVLRECLDLHARVTVVQPEELAAALGDGRGLETASTGEGESSALVITDSQAFRKVAETIRASAKPGTRLTSFSILYARQKGDLAEFVKGLEAVRQLKEGSSVLVSEGCTHHRQCEDIGTTKIPKALAKLSGCKDLHFTFSSGPAFGDDVLVSHEHYGDDVRVSHEHYGDDVLVSHEHYGDDVRVSHEHYGKKVALIVHCGSCMLTRRELLARIERAKAARIPIVNYGLVLQAAAGLGGVEPDGIVKL